MAENGKNDFIGKKSYEIAYALWRIGANTKERVLADKLFNKAIDFVGYAADENYDGLIAAMESLEMIIKFAVDVNCINVSNAAILAREIGNLQATIPANDFADADIDITDIFSAEKETPSEDFPRQKEDINFEKFSTLEPGNQEIGKRAEARQSAILEKIRQSGNCRLADIQAILPDLSERTIRYDLESLVQQNMIERIGTGGRSVYYQMKTTLGEPLPDDPK